MKLLKLTKCLICPFKQQSWTRSGNIDVCTNPINQDENGYCKEIPDPQIIPDFCELPDVPETDFGDIK